MYGMAVVVAVAALAVVGMASAVVGLRVLRGGGGLRRWAGRALVVGPGVGLVALLGTPVGLDAIGPVAVWTTIGGWALLGAAGVAARRTRPRGA